MSIEAYEGNLKIRLDELRRGDHAYDNHTHLILQAIIYSDQIHGEDDEKYHHRVLDCGCGLGFMTKKIHKFFESTGIDPSDQSIKLAKKEHPGVQFYNASAENFSEMMQELKIPSFDHAVLNMVLHSVDDGTALEILKGVKKCLRPAGTIIMIVPNRDWLVQKLIEYAQDQEMTKEIGIPWVAKRLKQKLIELPVRISDGSYYPEPITIYNRSEDDYEMFLKEAGFGYKWETYDTKTNKLIKTEDHTYLDMNDYFISDQVYQRNRLLMMSFSKKE
jgi:SAM-dependent methyltransferase